MSAYAADRCGADLSACAPVVFTIAANLPNLALVAQALQQQWQTAFPGLRITIATMDAAVLIKTRNLMLTIVGWGADYPDPQDFTTVLWNKDAPYNRGAVNVPAADALAARADVSTDAAERLALYQQAEQLWVNQGAFATLYQLLTSYLVRDRVVNFRYNASGVTANEMWQQVYVKA
jgi:oligopeptide transport system substrate-binding protein